MSKTTTYIFQFKSIVLSNKQVELYVSESNSSFHKVSWLKYVKKLNHNNVKNLIDGYPNKYKNFNDKRFSL